LNCPFCQQWNAPGASRCVFCDNRLDGAEDATGHGLPGYQRTLDAERLPRLSLVAPEPRSHGLPFSPRVMAYLCGGAFVALYLLAKAAGC
jgi:hypothetical protein